MIYLYRTLFYRHGNLFFQFFCTGGSLVKFLSEGLPTITTDWSKWRFFFCDERIVPFDNEESTYGVYKASLIGKLPIAENQFVTVDPELSGTEANARSCLTWALSLYFLLC